jgi:hypothetical protein
VGSSPGLVLLPVTVLRNPRFAFRGSLKLEPPNRDRDYRYCLAACGESLKAAPVANQRHGSDRIGVLRTPSTARIARGKFSRFHTVSQITIHLAVTHCRVLFTIHQFSDDKYPKWAYLDSRAACHLSTCVTWLPMPYPKITSARVSQIRSWQGALSHHAFMHSIEMNATYHISGRYFSRTKFWAYFLSQGYFAPSGSTKARGYVLGGLVSFLRRRPGTRR